MMRAAVVGEYIGQLDRDTEGRRLRGCLSRFATGVTVVTFQDRRGLHGLTVNAFTSVSLQPPLILVSISKKVCSHSVLRGRPFVVNILNSSQQLVARHFAGLDSGGTDIEWISGLVAPRLATGLAYLECLPWKSYDGGDHSLYLGEVVKFGYQNGDPLLFFGGIFTGIAPGQEHDS